MPIGVTICFGPAVVVGLMMRRKGRTTDTTAPKK